MLGQALDLRHSCSNRGKENAVTRMTFTTRCYPAFSGPFHAS
ncbi:hypothetical protein SAMN05216420_10344 [Nitrosospira sp. Nl5]|nr:hypothetical protein SAMN05216420_10344 [Nitrosospira sp. Nl5]